MDERKVDFGSLEWRAPLPCARYKASQQDGRQLRLVELAKGFAEPDWCTKGHVGYVLEGEMDVDFDGKIVRFSAGDGLMIPKGQENRHNARVITDVVKMILVEDAE
ncbi:MAG: cupin domain-containing protein [Phycisphaerae bacterium]|jgi:quercetin dioxygenase-like cupin family protein|nr:cupin domain-containing protein [Phycisphaerae bacterium]